MEREIDQYRDILFSDQNERLFSEWEEIDKLFGNDKEISIVIRKRNTYKLPITYEVIYNIKSICGVKAKDETGLQHPEFADNFRMRISLPNNYPSADAPPAFQFLTYDKSGNTIPHPWHPNIRYFGDFAGRVCLNFKDSGTFANLAWHIGRVANYLKYNIFHAENIYPFPEDPVVAEWVTDQAAPNEWLKF